MKQMWKNIGFSMIMGMVVPGMFLCFGVTVLERARMQPLPEPQVQTETAAERQIFLPVRFLDGNETVTQKDMDAYLVGVLLAEMPATFETEALKAQSVVARTYARKAYITGGKHGDGSVCGNPACCQGYTGEVEYLSSGGTVDSVEKIRSAILATSGQVLTYDGELIEATYFSSSGGRTEDAAAVWGTDFPYLQAVDSPGEEHAAYYTDTRQFTPEAFSKMLQLPLTGNPASWVGTTTYTEGGGVHTMIIGEETFTGTQLRSLLGLRSTAFTVTAEEDIITFVTRGFGHRVGMSQYGADAMARAGSSWEEILSHYYPGAVISCLS